MGGFLGGGGCTPYLLTPPGVPRGGQGPIPLGLDNPSPYGAEDSPIWDNDQEQNILVEGLPNLVRIVMGTIARLSMRGN